MTDQRSIRACAIMLTCFGPEVMFDTLWETEPQFQANLIERVVLDNAIDQVYDVENTGERGMAIIWHDFATRTDVEAANAKLHGERWLDEVEADAVRPGCCERIPPTWRQRLQDEREDYGLEGLARVRQHLECLRREAQQAGYRKAKDCS